MDATEHHGYLEAGAGYVYVTLHRPVAAARQLIVLLLPPFGEERKCAYRLLVRLARAWAALGCVVARPDLRGTGESTGEHRDATLEGWLDDARAVRDFAIEHTGATAWLAAGARLGANLAVRLAADPGASGALLLEPLHTGADYRRDLERRQQIKSALGGPAAGGAAQEQWAAGGHVDLGGFEIGAKLAGELAELRLAEDMGAVPDTCPVQLLRVSGARTFPPAWNEVCEQVERRPGGTAIIVRDKPFWGQLEYAESTLVLDAANASMRAIIDAAPPP